MGPYAQGSDQESQRHRLLSLSSGTRTNSAGRSTSLIDDDVCRHSGQHFERGRSHQLRTKHSFTQNSFGNAKARKCIFKTVWGSRYCSFGAKLGFNRSFDDHQQEPTPSTLITLTEAMKFRMCLSALASLSPPAVVLVDGDASRSLSPSYSGSRWCWHSIPRRDLLHVTLVASLDRTTQRFGSRALESYEIQRCSIIRLVSLRRSVKQSFASTILRPGPILGLTDHGYRCRVA